MTNDHPNIIQLEAIIKSPRFDNIVFFSVFFSLKMHGAVIVTTSILIISTDSPHQLLTSNYVNLVNCNFFQLIYAMLIRTGLF